MARGHLFSDPKIREEMLNLRLQGMSYKNLAKKYGVATSAIIYQCKIGGLILKEDDKKAIFELKKKGCSPKEAATILKASGTVVEFYYSHYEESNGIIIYKKTYFETSSPDELDYPLKVDPRDDRFRVDERGVGWVKDEIEGWICLGKTEKQRRLDEKKKKKKELEQKRIDMLTY